MALAIPSMLLKQLHTNGSLRNTDDGVQFSVKNRLSDATFTGLTGLKFDGYEVPADLAQSEVYAQMEELFNMVLQTWRFLP